MVVYACAVCHAYRPRACAFMRFSSESEALKLGPLSLSLFSPLPLRSLWPYRRLIRFRLARRVWCIEGGRGESLADASLLTDR